MASAFRPLSDSAHLSSIFPEKYSTSVIQNLSDPSFLFPSFLICLYMLFVIFPFSYNWFYICLYFIKLEQENAVIQLPPCPLANLFSFTLSSPSRPCSRTRPASFSSRWVGPGELCSDWPASAAGPAGRSVPAHCDQSACCGSGSREKEVKFKRVSRAPTNYWVLSK